MQNVFVVKYEVLNSILAFSTMNRKKVLYCIQMHLLILVFTVMTTCLIRRSGIRTFFSSFYGKILGALFKQYFYVGSEIEIPASNAQKI